MSEEILKGHQIHRSKNYDKDYFLFLEKIVNLRKEEINQYASKRFQKKFDGKFNITFKQFFCSNINSKKFNTKYFTSINNRKKIIFPLPLAIINLFQIGDIKFNKRISIIYFFFKCLKNLIKATIKVILIFFERNNLIFKNKKSVFFADLKIYFFPVNEIKNDFSCVGWFLKNEINKSDIDLIIHKEKKFTSNHIYKDKKFIYRNNLIPPIENIFLKFIFLIQGLIEILFCFFNLMRGKWIDCLFAEHSIDFLKLNNINAKNLPLRYYFSSSYELVRPLWTYFLKNSKCVYFNYAASIPGFFYNGRRDYDFYNRLLYWDEELHWSKYFIDYSLKINKDIKNIKLVDYIYGQDSIEKINLNLKQKRKKIAVFDITPPFEKMSIINNITNLNYHTAKNIIKFLDDIYVCAENLDFDILWKQRWDTINYTHHKNKNIHDASYIEYSKQFNLRKNVYKSHSYIAPLKLINICDLCISLPFTSTSLIADKFKKKSIFYDPVSILSSSDIALQGIKLISGSKELKLYLKSL